MKETHTREQLQKFQISLVAARTYSREADWKKLNVPLLRAGICVYSTDSKDLFAWFYSHKRTAVEREALFTNSIADIDRRIKELK